MHVYNTLKAWGFFFPPLCLSRYYYMLGCNAMLSFPQHKYQIPWRESPVSMHTLIKLYTLD
jgi:hypothetical protein